MQVPTQSVDARASWPAASIVLDGFTARVAGRSVVADVARRHLADLGAVLADAAGAADAAAHIVIDGEPQHAADVVVGWDGGIGCGLVDERTVQAACGVMHVHGRRGGRARALGVDYASAASGVLAVHAVLAALVGRSRGVRTSAARTSVADAALLAVSQYLANATARQDEDTVSDAVGAPPPFVSFEGTVFELEALDGEVWARFWRELGVTGGAVGRAWRSFVFRYATAECALPAIMHATTRAHMLEEIVAAAGSSGASICPLRSHDDRIAELGLHDAARVPPAWELESLGGCSGPLRAGQPGDMLPLSGLCVIEAGRRIQAPLAGHLLRCLGARVVRIEPPGGDPLRLMAPLAGATSARFRALNDGKEIVELDIKDRVGRRRLLELAAGADVFLHNWAPGKAAALGLDARDLAAVNPAIVFAYASAWGGACGPAAPLGTDFMVQAHAALAETTTPPDSPPAPSLMTVLDVMGGLLSVEAILAGLLRRQRTGEGQRVGSSLLNAATVLQADALEAAASGTELGRVGGRPRRGPLDMPLQTTRGLLAVTVRNDADLRRLAGACEVAQADTLDMSELERRIVDHVATQPARALLRPIRAAGIACSPVCEDLAELADDAPFLSALCIDGCAFVRAPWRWSQ